MGRRERYLVIRCLPGTQTQLPRAEPPVTVGVDLQGRARGGVGGGGAGPGAHKSHPRDFRRHRGGQRSRGNDQGSAQ